MTAKKERKCYFHTDDFGYVFEPVMLGNTRIADPCVELVETDSLLNQNKIRIIGYLRPENMRNPIKRDDTITRPTRVITKDRATIVFWEDDTKTVVKCCEDDYYIFDAAIIWAIAKKEFGTISQVHTYLEKLAKHIYVDNYDVLYVYFLVKKFHGDINKFVKYLDLFNEVRETHEK